MVELKLAEVWERIAAAAAASDRDAGAVTLVAVSKAQPVERVMAAYRAGHRDFGENRAQELVARLTELPTDVRWHFVGHLQRNKVRQVRPVVTFLHSMDRLELGREWLKGPGGAPPALLQVNVGGEPQKSGVLPEDVEATASGLLDLGVDLRGLMAMPPYSPDPEETRPHFRTLANLRDRLVARWPRLTELSMGMTEDYWVAVEEGATLVRVGRAIFGPREV